MDKPDVLANTTEHEATRALLVLLQPIFRTSFRSFSLHTDVEMDPYPYAFSLHTDVEMNPYAGTPVVWWGSWDSMEPTCELHGELTKMQLELKYLFPRFCALVDAEDAPRNNFRNFLVYFADVDRYNIDKWHEKILAGWNKRFPGYLKAAVEDVTSMSSMYCTSDEFKCRQISAAIMAFKQGKLEMSCTNSAKETAVIPVIGFAMGEQKNTIRIAFLAPRDEDDDEIANLEYIRMNVSTSCPINYLTYTHADHHVEFVLVQRYPFRYDVEARVCMPLQYPAPLQPSSPLSPFQLSLEDDLKKWGILSIAQKRKIVQQAGLDCMDALAKHPRDDDDKCSGETFKRKWMRVSMF